MSDALTYLMGNRWTKDAEGEFITVEDSHAVPPVSLNAEGKSTQVTTTGKNLLSNLADDWEKRAIPDVATRWVFLIPIEDGASYTWSRNDAGTPGFYFCVCNDLEFSDFTSLVTLTNRSTYTFTNSGGYSYIVIAISGSIAIKTVINDINNCYCQVEKTSAFTSYEPYSGGAASPRPDWPQDITSIDAFNVNYFGKNVIDQSVIEQGSVSRSCKNTVTTIRCRIPESVFLGFLNGATVSCTGNCSVGDFNYVIAGMRNSIYVSSGWLSSGASYTVPNDITSIRMIFRSANDAEVTPEDFSNIQLEVGSSASQYEPYIGNVAPLLPDGYSLRSLPDGTKDELHLTYLRPSDRPGWAWYSRELVKRVSSVDMGDIGWTYSTTYEYFSATLSDAEPAVDREVSTICETYICDANSTINGIRNSMSDKHVRMRNTYKQIFVRDSSYTTSESFTTAVNGVELLYPFAEPETITLDLIELPTMQQGLTNIWSDPSTNLSVTYERDRNIVISNMKAALDDLATS